MFHVYVSHYFDVGYKRGGTTLVGDIFNHHPDVFYLFEPAWYSQSVLPTKRRYDSSVIEAQKLIHLLETCNYSHPYLQSFVRFQVDYELFSRSSAVAKELQCDDQVLSERVAKCKHFAEICSASPNIWTNACSKHNVHVLKIVRLHVVDLEPFTRMLPGYKVKIILIVRDPRAVINSRLNIPWSGERTDPGKVCGNMLENYDSAMRLSLSSDIFKVIKYEDVADHPIPTTRDLFQFAGLSYPTTMDDFLRNITNGNSEDERREDYLAMDALSTVRRNSSRTARKWIKQLSKEVVWNIEKQCGEYMERVGYVPVEFKRKFDNIYGNQSTGFGFL